MTTIKLDAKKLLGFRIAATATNAKNGAKGGGPTAISALGAKKGVKGGGVPA